MLILSVSKLLVLFPLLCFAVTYQEVPTKASPYVDSALKPFFRLQNEYKDTLKQPVIHQWLEGALSETTQK